MNGLSSRILEPLRREEFGTGDIRSPQELDSRFPWGRILICLRLIAFHSCAVALSTETAPWYQDNAPSLIRTIGSLFLSVGLTMVVRSGAKLFTGNFMVE